MKIWNFRRYSLINEYRFKPILPAPFILISILLKIFLKIFKIKKFNKIKAIMISNKQVSKLSKSNFFYFSFYLNNYLLIYFLH
jgi:hypothetical protein